MAHVTASDGFQHAFVDFLAGSLGGINATLVGQPLDTVKVKMQTYPKLYKNMFDCIKTTIIREGFFRGLYAGTVPGLAANVAENSVLFAAYGGCQKFMQILTNSELQAAREAQMAGHASAVKIGPYRLTQRILNEEGFRGLFRGLDSTMAREMPGYFVFFGGYELTRELLAPPGGSKEDVGPLGTMAGGAVGGMAFWTVIFPADVTKSRIQVQGLTDNMFKVIYRIWRTEGIMALYNGLGPTLFRTIPATATLFLTVETTKKVLRF